MLGGMHPQAGLVALMAKRGFADEKDALTRIDAASLLKTRAVDEPGGTEGATNPFVLRRRRRFSGGSPRCSPWPRGISAWLVRF